MSGKRDCPSPLLTGFVKRGRYRRAFAYPSASGSSWFYQMRRFVGKRLVAVGVGVHRDIFFDRQAVAMVLRKKRGEFMSAVRRVTDEQDKQQRER